MTITQTILLAVTCVAVVGIFVGLWSWFLLSTWKAYAELLTAFTECDRIREDLQERIDSLLADLGDDADDSSRKWKGSHEEEDDEDDEGEEWKKAGI